MILVLFRHRWRIAAGILVFVGVRVRPRIGNLHRAIGVRRATSAKRENKAVMFVTQTFYAVDFYRAEIFLYLSLCFQTGFQTLVARNTQ